MHVVQFSHGKTNVPLTFAIAIAVETLQHVDPGVVAVGEFIFNELLVHFKIVNQPTGQFSDIINEARDGGFREVLRYDTFDQLVNVFGHAIVQEMPNTQRNDITILLHDLTISFDIVATAFINRQRIQEFMDCIQLFVGIGSQIGIDGGKEC